MYEMKQRILITGDISSEIALPIRRKRTVKRCVFYFLRKTEVERSEISEFNIGEGVT